MRTVVLVSLLAGCVDVDTATIGEPIIHGAVDTTHGAVVAVINTTMGFSCSGTVIAVDGVTAVVLTAAHCAPADIVLTGDDYATPTATYAVTDILVQGFYQGVLTAVVSLVLYSFGVARLGASTAGAFIALGPVVAALLAIVALGEWPRTSDWIGIAIITVGVALASGSFPISARSAVLPP